MSDYFGKEPQDGEQLAPDVERRLQLLGVVEATVQDVDDLLKRAESEQRHARALEANFSFFERLTEQHSRSIDRCNDTLELLDRYCDDPASKGSTWADELDIIDAEFDMGPLNDLEELTLSNEAPPLADHQAAPLPDKEAPPVADNEGTLLPDNEAPPLADNETPISVPATREEQ